MPISPVPPRGKNHKSLAPGVKVEKLEIVSS
jgi:hypothetical protein